MLAIVSTVLGVDDFKNDTTQYYQIAVRPRKGTLVSFGKPKLSLVKAHLSQEE